VQRHSLLLFSANAAILSSSVAERSTVNRLVVGSNPTWGVLNNWYSSVAVQPETIEKVSLRTDFSRLKIKAKYQQVS
jgi:hypothetical protein